MHQRSIQITLWSAYLAVCVHMCLVHVQYIPCYGEKMCPYEKNGVLVRKCFSPPEENSLEITLRMLKTFSDW